MNGVFHERWKQSWVRADETDPFSDRHAVFQGSEKPDSEASEEDDPFSDRHMIVNEGGQDCEKSERNTEARSDSDDDARSDRTVVPWSVYQARAKESCGNVQENADTIRPPLQQVPNPNAKGQSENVRPQIGCRRVSIEANRAISTKDFFKMFKSLSGTPAEPIVGPEPMAQLDQVTAHKRAVESPEKKAKQPGKLIAVDSPVDIDLIQNTPRIFNDNCLAKAILRGYRDQQHKPRPRTDSEIKEPAHVEALGGSLRPELSFTEYLAESRRKLEQQRTGNSPYKLPVLPPVSDSQHAKGTESHSAVSDIGSCRQRDFTRTT